MPKTRYVWDEDNISHETDEDGDVTAAYTYAPKPYGELVSERRDGHAYRHYYDGLGSTIAMTDETGAVTDTFAYDAWGEEIARTGDTPTPFRWIGDVGFYWDSEVNSFSVHNRRYIPHTARWLAMDLLEFLDGMNRYVFVGNSPITYMDPSGLGFYKWLYTGDWNASDETYQAALEGAAGAILCWYSCEGDVHQKVTTYIGHAVTTGGWALLERVKFVAKSLSEIAKYRAMGSPQTSVSLISRAANVAYKNNWPRTHEVLRNHMRYTKNFPIRSALRTCIIGVAITETIIAWVCSFRCNRS